jgi:hypothetical protein
MRKITIEDIKDARIVNVLDAYESRYGEGTMTANAIVVEKEGKYYLVDGYLDNDLYITEIEKDDYRITSNTLYQAD